MVVSRTGLYPLAEQGGWRGVAQLRELLASHGKAATPGMAKEHVRAKWTGEKRAPRAGEWFISGAIPQAYMAGGDLESAHLIAALVVVKRTVSVVEEEC